MTTEICPCTSDKPVIGMFFGPKGFLGGSFIPDRAVPACEDCVQEYALTVEPQQSEDES